MRLAKSRLWGSGLPIFAGERVRLGRGERHLPDARAVPIHERLYTDPALDLLARHGAPEAPLKVAERRAADHGTPPLQELFALGLDRNRYWSLLAGELGVRFVDDLSGAQLLSNSGLLTTEALRRAGSVLVSVGDETLLVTAPRPDELVLLRRRMQAMPQLAGRIAIAPPETIRAFIAARKHPALTHYALNRLAAVLPRLSAGRQRSSGISGRGALVAAVLALGLVAPVALLMVLGLLSTLFFVNCSFWKLAAAFHRLRPPRLEPLLDRQLPTYAVLIPLYREAAVVPDLVEHIGRLDYPKSKLQVLLILEADDKETRAAVLRHATHPHFEVVSVPPGGPRTKPKALSYALAFVRSDCVVVFDAEDRPEPAQLRKAAAAFREQPQLGCVQARLAPDNDDSWLARMFTLEYAANFENLLPALAEWGAPLPLGGTSNHFPREVLERVCAWDPFNVTEDADLGIRLARFGYRTATIFSHTYEEAPVTFRQWLPQRRRWIKGWMQTVAVCLGKGIPEGLRLSLRDRLAVHGILTAGVLGLLLYPASLCVIAAAIVAALNGTWPTAPLAWALLVLNLGNLAAILIAATLSSVRGLGAASRLRLVTHIPLLPVYWALMSLAAWQALVQYFRNPSVWEKTAHGVARKRQAPRRVFF